MIRWWAFFYFTFRRTGLKLLYTRHDAADALSISLRQVDYLIANKKLNTRRIGRSVRIPHADLVRFSQGNHYQTSAA